MRYTLNTPPTFDEEMTLSALGHRAVAGVDEAGRGPLAGPVVAGAVVLPLGFRSPPGCLSVRDSKLLSAGQREGLFCHIRESGIAWSYGVVSSEDVDALGIAPATREAMLRAIREPA